LAQIRHNQAIRHARMHTQNGNRRGMTKHGREHARSVQHRLGLLLVQKRTHGIFTAQSVGESKQLRLLVANQPRQVDRGAHITQRIMRVGMSQPIRCGQVGELETWRTVFTPGPLDTLRAQGIGVACQIQKIPARIAVAPFVRISIKKIAIKQKSRK